MSILGMGAGAGRGAPVSVEAGKDGFKHFAAGGTPFVPIGVNYLVPHVGPPYQTFAMFDDGTFRESDIAANLHNIRAEGFTFVRLFLKGVDPDRGFELSGSGLGGSYLGHIVTVLRIARSDGLRVVLTGAFRTGLWLPRNYVPPGLPSESAVGGMNRLILLPQMAEATSRLYHDLLTGIRALDKTALDTVFYIDLYNELHFDLAQPPFNGSGESYAFDGKTYDLSNPAARQTLMDRAATQWIRTVKSGVVSVDPHLLITASTFPLAASGHARFDGGASRKASRSSPYPLRPGPMILGGIDILDIHIYPSAARANVPPFHARLGPLLASTDVTVSTARRIPMIAGEYGAMKGKFADPEQSVPELQATEAVMCGLHISGLAVWMWQGLGDTWDLDNPRLMQTLAPRYHPDFCGQTVMGTRR